MTCAVEPSRTLSRRSFGVGCLAAAVTACSGDVEKPSGGTGAFGSLPGWSEDNIAAAAHVFEKSLTRLRPTKSGSVLLSDWQEVRTRWPELRSSPRQAFETLFTPVRIGTGAALYTGYYEPELAASRHRHGVYQHPIYAKPRGLRAGRAYFSRAQIAAGALAGRGEELFWLADPIEGFFLEIQGSGRLRLDDGTFTRVGFSAKNGHRYRAIGKVLVDRGDMTLEEASAQSIKAWLRSHPDQAQALMNQNPSYVFFVERTDILPSDGPVGALSVPVTAGRSIAVDPAFHPLGAPVWVTMDDEQMAPRLMIAQDVGGAIKGPQRADIFVGSGDEAGEIAGAMRATGAMITLLPNAAAARFQVA